MSSELEFPGKDEATTAAMRELYAPPGGESYWAELERKIVAKVAMYGERHWWEAFEHWKRAGLIAAALLLAVVGLTLLRFRNMEPAVALQERGHNPILQESTDAYTQSGAPMVRDRSFNYVLTH